jgi:hypothetical protein
MPHHNQLTLPGTPHRTHGERRKPRHPTERLPRREKRDRVAEKRAREEAWRVPPATPEETTFRHGHWQPRRQRVRAAMVRCGASTFVLDRFDNCGSECSIEWSEELQRHRVRANYCKSRHCEPCARAKGNLIARNLRDALADAPRNQHRFITLTLKHSTAPLADQIRRLYACFKKLRGWREWKSTQRGGCFMLEVKWTGAAWHPHLHIISAGRYLLKQTLSELWHRATGDSMIVDVQAIDSAKDVVHYVCKYISKGSSAQVWQSDELSDQFIIATRGVRACGTFGSWRSFKLLARPAIGTDWKPVGRLSNIWNEARGGATWAIAVLLSIRQKDVPIELE